MRWYKAFIVIAWFFKFILFSCSHFRQQQTISYLQPYQNYLPLQLHIHIKWYVPDYRINIMNIKAHGIVLNKHGGMNECRAFTKVLHLIWSMWHQILCWLCLYMKNLPIHFLLKLFTHDKNLFKIYIKY